MAMFRNLVTSLVQHERIRTTLAKAKEVRPFADRVVTWGKEGTHPYRQKVLGFVRTPDVAAKCWNDLAKRYADRHGGYTRVIRCGYRTGDRAPMAILEYVGREGEVRPARPAAPPGSPTTAGAVRYRAPPADMADVTAALKSGAVVTSTPAAAGGQLR